MNVTFREDYDDYDDGVILTCFENRLSECSEDLDHTDMSDAKLEIDDDSLPDLESVSREVNTIAAREVIRLMQLGFFGKVKYCINRCGHYHAKIPNHIRV